MYDHQVTTTRCKINILPTASASACSLLMERHSKIWKKTAGKPLSLCPQILRPKTRIRRGLVASNSCFSSMIWLHRSRAWARVWRLLDRRTSKRPRGKPRLWLNLSNLWQHFQTRQTGLSTHRHKALKAYTRTISHAMQYLHWLSNTIAKRKSLCSPQPITLVGSSRSRANHRRLSYLWWC